MSENSKDGKKKGSSKAVGLAIGAVVLTSIFGVSVPLVILIGAGAFGIGKLVGIMSQPLDLTTHNRQDRQKQEVEDLRMSGDAEADPVITKGQEMLREIRAANDAIPDPGLSRQMDQLGELCVQIFRTVSEKPSKAPQIRKFMNYYLPTTLKMLNSYRTMQDRGVSSQNLSEARRTLSRGMDMILTACQKQLTICTRTPSWMYPRISTFWSRCSSGTDSRTPPSRTAMFPRPRARPLPRRWAPLPCPPFIPLTWMRKKISIRIIPAKNRNDIDRRRNPPCLKACPCSV